jgi:hypothetical protein
VAGAAGALGCCVEACGVDACGVEGWASALGEVCATPNVAVSTIRNVLKMIFFMGMNVAPNVKSQI